MNVGAAGAVYRRGSVKGIQDGLKGLEVLRPGVVPVDLPDDVAPVQELKRPANSVKNLFFFIVVSLNTLLAPPGEILHTIQQPSHNLTGGNVANAIKSEAQAHRETHPKNGTNGHLC